MNTSSRCQPFTSGLGVLLGSLLACLGLARTPVQAQTIRTQPPPAQPAPAATMRTQAPPGEPATPSARPAPRAQPAAVARPSRVSTQPQPATAQPPAAPATLPTQPASAPAQAIATEPAPTGPRLSLVQAIRVTLQQHPAIAQAHATIAQRAADVEAARAPFDSVLSAQLGHAHDNSPLLQNERLDPRERSAITDTTDLSLGMASAFQWGMSVAPSVSLERAHARHDPNALALPTTPGERARAGLTVTQSLLRGFGTTGAASGLHAAERLRESAEHGAAYAAQAQVYDTIVAYYRLVAALLDLDRYRESQARSEQLLAETKVMVEAENRPRADLRQVQASLANQTRGLFEAEANALAAQHALGLAMGLDGREPPPLLLGDGLPDVQVAAEPAPGLVEEALHTRRDLHAAEASLESASVALAGAERNTLPTLDLGLSVGYAGAVQGGGVDGFFTSAGRNVPGLNGGATLTLQLPIENTRQRAERDLRKAERWSAEIDRDNIKRQVRTRVRSALDELRLSAAALAAAMDAVNLLDQAVGDERDKLHEGLSTVIDVVLTQERLTQAQLLRNSDQLRYATALAALQFEAGALPSSETEVATSAEALLSREATHVGR